MGLWFRVRGLGAKGLGFMVQGLVFRLGSRVYIRVLGLGVMIRG
jgi:hypothetical protein